MTNGRGDPIRFLMLELGWDDLGGRFVNPSRNPFAVWLPDTPTEQPRSSGEGAGEIVDQEAEGDSVSPSPSSLDAPGQEEAAPDTDVATETARATTPRRRASRSRADPYPKDLHVLPKVRDSLSYIYLEHGRIDQRDQSIAFHGADGVIPVPAASLAVLMLGPGTDVTHAAMRMLAANNCLVIWCGEENVRLYAIGLGGTRGAEPLLHQAWLASDPRRRLEVVKRMYETRFGEVVDERTSIEQLRGKEGLRIRNVYARLSKEHGVAWSGRNYDRSAWGKSDPINRAISAANSCLYGVCHAAILSVGLSSAIGFMHTGKQLSFVYDIADLYKVEITLPIAFRATTEGATDLERRVRLACRDRFRESRLLTRVVPNMWKVLGDDPRLKSEGFLPDADSALPTALWTPEDELGDLASLGGDSTEGHD